MIWLLLAALLTTGCASLYGPMAEYEGSFECKGKFNITGTGNINVGAGVGGGQGNGFAVSGDCGDGFKIQRERYRAPTDPAPASRK